MMPFITSRTSTWRLLPPRLAGGIQRRNKRPFLIRQIARVTQSAAVVSLAVFCRPHLVTILELGPPLLNHK